MRAGPEKALYETYAKRLPWPLALKEFAEPKGQANRPAREAELLLKATPERAVLIALDERGRAFSSEAFAQRVGAIRDSGAGDLAFLIGGADGLADAVRERAELLLSFGAMTWPHLLVRAMLAEQLYRASAILAGHPYHRA